jgi:hypothetical protein
MLTSVREDFPMMYDGSSAAGGRQVNCEASPPLFRDEPIKKFVRKFRGHPQG